MPTVELNPQPVPTSWNLSGAKGVTPDGPVELHLLQFTTAQGVSCFFLDDAGLAALVAAAQERLGKPRLEIARELPPSNGKGA